MDDLRAVMDAAGSGRAALLGTSEAGALNLLFSATHPDRAAALILLNSYARLTWAEDYSCGIRPNEAEGLLDAIESGWGKGVAFEALVASQSDNDAMRNWWARYQRQAASPGTAVMLLRRAFDTDARGVLSSITAPTLILHKAGDPFTGPEHGRYLAERIPAARYVELSGIDHLFFAEDSVRLVAEIQEFLTGVRDASEPDRVLATVLFSDIVGLTETAARIGDRRWQDIIQSYYAVIHTELARFRGNEINTAGDGVFASFDGPARAIRCGLAICEAVRQFGIDVRVGVHTGECELIAGKIGGHPSLSCLLFVGAVGRRGGLLHEASHLVRHLLVRLQAHVEIKNHLGESGGLDLLQRIHDPLRRAQQHRVLGEVFWFDRLQARDHVDEVAVARWGGFRISGQRRDFTFAVIADLAGVLRGS